MVSQGVLGGLELVPWSSLRMGMMHHDPVIQMPAKEQLEADEKRDLLRRSLRGIEEPNRWAEVQFAIQRLEAQAGERVERAVHHGKVLRRNAIIPPGLWTRMQQEPVLRWPNVDMARLEATIAKFVDFEVRK